jgi:drug/metabolite transporter (DMT)-like permease
MDTVQNVETLPLTQSIDRTWILNERIALPAEPTSPFPISPLEIATDDESNASSRIPPNVSSIGFSAVNELSLPSSPSRPYKAGIDTILDKLIVVAALMAWYGISVFSIVTTKILVQTWNCPPIVLTVQQLILGTILLRFVLLIRDGAIQPWPWDMTSTGITISAVNNPPSNDLPPHAKSFESPRESTMENELLLDRMKRQMPWLKHPNFVWSGIFNSCDFLATNFAFSLSSAHFVETIKASEPITTTAIALFWKVDGLSMMEATSLSVLITGVIMSTWGNSTDENMIADEQKLLVSVQTASLAILANVNFGFRAINQKKYRSTTHETEQLDDINFLCRMMQVGAIFLLLPTLLMNFHTLGRALHAPGELQLTYVGLSMINSVSYVTYK